MVKIKRVYEAPSAEDGTRILVDRLWPRGIKKENAHIDRWAKELAPSNELRKSFCHVPEKWPEFRVAYLRELEAHGEELRELGKLPDLTLLYAAKDEQYNNAVVLFEAITNSQ